LSFLPVVAEKEQLAKDHQKALDAQAAQAAAELKRKLMEAELGMRGN
jgi:hypothetical protein